MSHAEVVQQLPPPMGAVPVAELKVDTSFRGGGLCAEQVERFIDLGGAWPAILVRRDDGLVIDGAHRVAAARRLNLREVDAVFFDGSSEEAFIQFVRLNVAHGLMLTLIERKKAAARILVSCPAWSDRRVAELCALAPKTVGRLRVGLNPSSVDGALPLDAGLREGRDRRLRPVRHEPARARVIEALREQPNASLRTIATAVGVSPETVRVVRLAQAKAEPAADPAPAVDEPVPGTGEPWRGDAALASSDRGDDLLTWLERTAVGEPDLGWVTRVPLSRVYEVAAEARRRAEVWVEFARGLESRPARVR